MKMLFPGITEPIYLNKNATALILENSNHFRAVVKDIFDQSNGINGKCILSENDNRIEIKSCADIIINLFDINSLQKKSSTVLHKCLIKELHYTNYDTITSMSTYIYSLFNKIFNEYPVPLSYKDAIDLSTYIKGFDVKLALNQEEFIEDYLTYMTFMSTFDRKRLFIFVNFACFFDKDTFKYFHKMIIYKNINVLFLENNSHGDFYENVNFFIVDDDMCFF